MVESSLLDTHRSRESNRIVQLQKQGARFFVVALITPTTTVFFFISRRSRVPKGRGRRQVKGLEKRQVGSWLEVWVGGDGESSRADRFPFTSQSRLQHALSPARTWGFFKLFRYSSGVSSHSVWAGPASFSISVSNFQSTRIAVLLHWNATPSQ